MYWNYRMTKHIVGEETLFEIREVYYNSNDEVVGWSDNPAVVRSDTNEGLIKGCQWMLEGTRDPILDLDSLELGQPEVTELEAVHSDGA